MPVIFATGNRLTPARLNALPKGVIARANRNSSSSTTTGEVGVLRLDDLAIGAGRSYRIWTSPFVVHSTVANDVVRARLRFSTSGAATTSSSLLDMWQTSVTNTVNPPSGLLAAKLESGTNLNVSVLLTIARQSGTGNASIISGSGPDLEIDLIVEDIGLNASDTGVDI
jgi:hypothetical protein